MRDTSGKIENGGLTTQGQLSADEHNDVIEDLVDNVVRSGQTVEAANTSQTAESSTLASWIAPTMEVGSGGTENDLRLVTISGSSGFKMPAPNVGVYDRLNGARIIFKATATNTGNVIINIGQTIGALLGSKKLLDFAEAELSAGDIVDTNLVECIYLTALDSGTGAWQLTRSALVQSDWDQTSSLQPDFIKNKPTGFELIPTGVIVPWPVDSEPTGTLTCNSQEVDRTTYAALFAVIGTTYGVGDGSTTFNVPDYRGYFLRGMDDGEGVDPNAASRTDRGDGITGDNVGTKQEDEFESHTHTIYPLGSPNSNGSPAGQYNMPPTKSGASGAAGGSTETRPKNINIIYLIKT